MPERGGKFCLELKSENWKVMRKVDIGKKEPEERLSMCPVSLTTSPTVLPSQAQCRLRIILRANPDASETIEMQIPPLVTPNPR